MAEFTLNCLVDNLVLRGSALQGEHGVAFWIETPQGSLLFDSGQSGDVLVHNAELMDIDLGCCDALALSHAHYDHTGGLEQFFRLSQVGIPLYGSPDLFRERFSVKDGELRSIGLRMAPNDMVERTTSHLSADPVEILPCVWTTGEIRDRVEFEGRSAQHRIWVYKTWRPDPYQDDISLMLQTSQGLVIVCGCCHAGILNTLTHIRRFFPQPLLAIIGGTHLAAVGPESLDRVVVELCDRCEGRVPDLYLNHCTGEQAIIRLAQSFGENVHPCPAGTVLSFD
jgi:7,8-dihydropterin-6-yl-methyl-4-(beta-D-ribofuranosyl)aminobenzene 5'-phosphate synthase